MDFEGYRWHDCHLWGLSLVVGDPERRDWTSDLLLDIDYTQTLRGRPVLTDRQHLDRGRRRSDVAADAEGGAGLRGERPADRT